MNLRDAKTLANKTMMAHGLKQQGWVFKFDKAVGRSGQCSFRNRTISLSEPVTLLNPKEEVLDTILHEVAHALTPGCGHNRQWKQMAIAIGSSGFRCAPSNTVTPPKKFIGKCPSCPMVIERHRRRKGVYHTSCWRMGKKEYIIWERKAV